MSWMTGAGAIGMSPGVNICCATFPHLDKDGVTRVFDKFCYPRTVLNMEFDTRYMKAGQTNPYTLAWCFATHSVTVVTAIVLSAVLAF